MSTKIILDKDHVFELVSANKYPVSEKTKFLSRCIDGRYSATNLPGLSFPGADAGELALILATANSYGFEVDEKKTLQVLLKILDGEKNFNMHSDHHGDAKIPASGCGHIREMRLDPKTYSLSQDNIKILDKQLSALKKKGAKETILSGDHMEGAVILVKGLYGIYTQGELNMDGVTKAVQVFVYHSTLTDQRHKALASALLETKAVKLLPEFDSEYLYHALSETADNHLMETAKRLAPGLPIFAVNFQENGNFKIEEMGTV